MVAKSICFRCTWLQVPRVRDLFPTPEFELIAMLSKLWVSSCADDFCGYSQLMCWVHSWTQSSWGLATRCCFGRPRSGQVLWERANGTLCNTCLLISATNSDVILPSAPSSYIPKSSRLRNSMKHRVQVLGDFREHDRVRSWKDLHTVWTTLDDSGWYSLQMRQWPTLRLDELRQGPGCDQVQVVSPRFCSSTRLAGWCLVRCIGDIGVSYFKKSLNALWTRGFTLW